MTPMRLDSEQQSLPAKQRSLPAQVLCPSAEVVSPAFPRQKLVPLQVGPQPLVSALGARPQQRQKGLRPLLVLPVREVVQRAVDEEHQMEMVRVWQVVRLASLPLWRLASERELQLEEVAQREEVQQPLQEPACLPAVHPLSVACCETFATKPCTLHSSCS